jgi:hypothetical protein
MKKIILLLTLAIAAYSCSDDGGNTPSNASVGFKFTQNWDGTNVTKADLNSSIFTNEKGNKLTISKLRYLVSHIVLHKKDGTNTEFSEHNLVDLTDDNSLELMPSLTVPTGDYIGISFVYGFNEEDNGDGAYPDLNAAAWNWPAMLGGGYHFMQMEGTYKDINGDTQPYAYHNGTARVSEGVFEQNFIAFDFDKNFTINDDATIEIKMNIAEWYKNPYTWDLNVLNIDLMMNYDAQKHMNDNGSSVFSIGAITQ